jgi:SAM-dependent methyltransferase
MKESTEISHPYAGLGQAYLKARKGSPRFAEFMISQSGLKESEPEHPISILELGVGSGQQTEFVEKELNARGITNYRILAYDKSHQENPEDNPGQLDILTDRIQRGELSERVIPVHHDFDEAPLPIESESIDLTYMAHVVHHLANKQQVLDEIARVTRKGKRFFILGVTLDGMKNHPLDEFFPTKYEYETGRYPTKTELKKLFESAGFSYENPFRTGRHQVRAIDREFLAGIENTTIDSVLKIMEHEDPKAFKEGVARVKKEVEKGEKAGRYRTYYSSGRLRVFRGIKE